MDPSESSFTFLPFGAIIQEFRVNGLNIVQNFPTEDLYKTHNSPYFGATIGRVANRIAGAKINSLNGRSYDLHANDGPNSLHGGRVGWGRRDFEGPVPLNRGGKESVLFKLLSPDGEDGYPGTVELCVWYAGMKEQQNGIDKTVLEVEFEAELMGKDDVQETVINVTNHSYFKLTDAATFDGTEATLSTDQHLVVDESSIPTGAIEPHPSIPSTGSIVLGDKEPAIDHCFIMNTEPATVPLDTRLSPLRMLASFYHPETKMHLEVLSTEPAFQFYTGDGIDVPAVEGTSARGPRSGFCVEPSRYVNAVNMDAWKGMVTLKQGQKYGSKIVYQAWQE
ncbi:hypothetical protein H2199_002269 [Coniosporium tulheliwenetii]|uniref:Uncharacterized protein n=1 Tax=Coniosporium tulheliwenetii TaxID=3383036 RepID=A0ACC2ZIE1_9PEZI|nr:hypothetical protein H2199_002269 [Cladosporium sp. JES 115]